ncbi:hypothetical protein CVT26_010946 [Gymnopilus dilepis]|uniref:Uncharacterized protein n=1 Tax=Gymnopilus dilepis TaxID=231916 RepID=A0A409VJ25_9AGAR|nr:hypothetical protein CVT26_010946 [Gymnopilus dilepis]
MPEEEKAEIAPDIEKGDEEPIPKTRSDPSQDALPRRPRGLSRLFEERHRSTYYRTTFISIRAMAFLEFLWGLVTLIYEGQQPIQLPDIEDRVQVPLEGQVQLGEKMVESFKTPAPSVKSCRLGKEQREEILRLVRSMCHQQGVKEHYPSNITCEAAVSIEGTVYQKSLSVKMIRPSDAGMNGFTSLPTSVVYSVFGLAVILVLAYSVSAFAIRAARKRSLRAAGEHSVSTEKV